jgi:hypothetical protein
LRRQRQLLAARIAHCQAMVTVIDKELSVRKLGISLTPQERLEVFGSIPLEELADEAERGLGGTAEWPRQQRTSAYTVQDWQQLLAESASIHQRLLDAMNDRVPAADPAVMDLAEEHRQHTDRWYHDCGHEIHRQYAQAYLANDDDMTPGLAQYCHDAIIANCQRAADDQDHPVTAGSSPKTAGPPSPRWSRPSAHGRRRPHAGRGRAPGLPTARLRQHRPGAHRPIATRA